MSSDNKYLLRNCIVCGKAFRTARYHAKTCSNACRMKHSRAGQKKKTQVETVTMSYLEWLLDDQRLTMHEGLSPNTPEDWQN